jgi:hypothetical protein
MSSDLSALAGVAGAAVGGIVAGASAIVVSRLNSQSAREFAKDEREQDRKGKLYIDVLVYANRQWMWANAWTAFLRGPVAPLSEAPVDPTGAVEYREGMIAELQAFGSEAVSDAFRKFLDPLVQLRDAGTGLVEIKNKRGDPNVPPPGSEDATKWYEFSSRCHEAVDGIAEAHKRLATLIAQELQGRHGDRASRHAGGTEP